MRKKDPNVFNLQARIDKERLEAKAKAQAVKVNLLKLSPDEPTL